MRRTSSPTKPLVDLTPKFVEAPQWSREGKGHGVAAPRGAACGGCYWAAGTQVEGTGAVGVLFRREG